MKINELEVGRIVDIVLVVKSATARETKAKKPYLSLEFYDGVDTINGNYWDWGGTNIPANALEVPRVEIEYLENGDYIETIITDFRESKLFLRKKFR